MDKLTILIMVIAVIMMLCLFVILFLYILHLHQKALRKITLEKEIALMQNSAPESVQKFGTRKISIKKGEKWK